MKISRVKKAAISTIAVMALAGAGAASAFAVDTPGTTAETGVEATETAGVETAEPAGTGVEVDAVGGYADTVADAQTEQTGEH